MMGPRSRSLRSDGLLAAATVLGLVLAGCAGASGATPASPAAVPVVTPGSGTVVQPLPPVAGTGSGGAAGPSIAYPYPIYPGSPGLAPDHTIVVTGFGRAPVQADLSDRATAEQAALDAALADAKAQADEVAKVTGVSISGVLSVSVSTRQGFFGPVPLPATGVPGRVSASGKPTAVQPAPPMIPGDQQIDVSVTVAYRIG